MYEQDTMREGRKEGLEFASSMAGVVWDLADLAAILTTTGLFL